MFKYTRFILLLLVFSCATNKQEEGKLTFSPKSLPGFTISGVIGEDNGKEILYITQVRLFSNWHDGWTEGFFEASGKYEIVRNGNDVKLLTIDPFELWDITAGEIRYKDKYYRGDDGLWKVKYRIDRLKELSRVLKNDMGFPNTLPDLKKELMPYLFPELYNFNKLEKSEKLPQKFYQGGFEEEVIRANGIKWRKDYTKSIFPEEFWDLRDSGTLYRDILEAPSIFKTLYNMEDFFNKEEIIL